MNSQQPPHYDEPTSKTALALSAAVHAVLVAALFFGVQWKNEQPGGAPVDVYFGNPAASPPLPRPTPDPEPTPVPDQKPLPKPEPKAVETPKIDPQIAIKDKVRREKEEKEKLEKERLEKEKAEKLKKQKQEEEQKQKEEEKKKREQKEKEARREDAIAKELERDLKQAREHRSSETVRSLQSELDAELKELRGSPNGSPTGNSSGSKASAGNASSRGKDAYIGKIRDKIRGNTVLPPGIQGNPEAVFKVTQLPSGEIIDIKLSKSSGNKALDEAIERAIKKSDPLPLPDQPNLFERVLELKYKPFNE